jgi:alkylhydroperoxidase family enzyme
MNKDKKPLAPLPPAQWPPELDDIRRELGNPLNIHNIMAHHAALTRAWMPYRNHIVANSSLEPKHRELLILRTARNCSTTYEWEHHVVRGRDAGLSDEEIQRVKEGPAAAQWPPAVRLLLQAADECHHNSKISDETYHELCLHFDEHQQLDIIATVGMYMTLATIIKTYGVPLENNEGK